MDVIYINSASLFFGGGGVDDCGRILTAVGLDCWMVVCVRLRVIGTGSCVVVLWT